MEVDRFSTPQDIRDLFKRKCVANISVPSVYSVNTIIFNHPFTLPTQTHTSHIHATDSMSINLTNKQLSRHKITQVFYTFIDTR